jgi:hypothetical protein
MMPTAADFRVINDLARSLTPAEPLTFRFDVPASLARGPREPQSVLLVKYFLEGASALTFEVSLNGTRLSENSGSGSHLLLNMEAFDAQLLLPGENQLDVRFLRGLGVIRIADMVVHFRIQF